MTLTFNEDVDQIGAAVQIVGPDGRRYEDGPPVVRGRVVEQSVRPGLPDGTSMALWTVISTDGHRIAQAFPF